MLGPCGSTTGSFRSPAFGRKQSLLGVPRSIYSQKENNILDKKKFERVCILSKVSG